MEFREYFSKITFNYFVFYEVHYGETYSGCSVFPTGIFCTFQFRQSFAEEVESHVFKIVVFQNSCGIKKCGCNSGFSREQSA